MRRWWRRSRCNDDGRTFTPDEEIEGRDTAIMLGHVRTLCGSAAATRRLPETSLLPRPTARELRIIGTAQHLTNAAPEKTRTACPICP